MEAEWCECRSSSGFAYLYRADGSCVGDPMVHSECGKPSFLVWQAHERTCEECGRSFSTPWAEVCLECVTTFQSEEWWPYEIDPNSYPSWSWMLQQATTSPIGGWQKLGQAT